MMNTLKRSLFAPQSFRLVIKSNKRIFSASPYPNFVFRSTNYSVMAKAMLATGVVGYGYHKLGGFSQLSYCQAGLSDFNDYAGRLTTINHIGATKHLMSNLRDKKTDTATFRHYSDRIMRLLIEEALA